MQCRRPNERAYASFSRRPGPARTRPAPTSTNVYNSLPLNRTARKGPGKENIRLRGIDHLRGATTNRRSMNDRAAKHPTLRTLGSPAEVKAETDNAKTNSLGRPTVPAKRCPKPLTAQIRVVGNCMAFTTGAPRPAPNAFRKHHANTSGQRKDADSITLSTCQKTIRLGGRDRRRQCTLTSTSREPTITLTTTTSNSFPFGQQ